MSDRVLVDIDTEFANRYKYNICSDKERPHLFYFWTDLTYSCYIRKLRGCYAVCGNFPDPEFIPIAVDVNKSIYFRHSDLETVVKQWRYYISCFVNKGYPHKPVEFDFRKKQI